MPRNYVPVKVDRRFRGNKEAPPNFGPRWSSKLERDIMRHACRDHLAPFFEEAWGVLHGPHRDSWEVKRYPFWRDLAEWFEERIRDWLADRATGHGKVHYLAVLVSRDLGKTNLITKAGNAWIHLQDPDLSTYIGSEKTDFAIDMLRSMLPVLNGTDPHARFAMLYGNWEHPERSWTDRSIIHAQRRNLSRGEPSMGTWGVETGLTSKHPDVLFLDDPISYEKMATNQEWLKVVNDHTTSLIPVIKDDGLVIWPGTRYSSYDHFGTAFAAEGIASIAGMPMKDFSVREGGKWHVFFMSGRDQDGYPTVPGVWPEDRMKTFAAKDPSRYAAQILNSPGESEHNPITRAQIDEMWVDGKDAPYSSLRYVVHCDCAWKSKERQNKGDQSVFVIMGHTRDGSGDVYYIEGYGSTVWRGEDFFTKLVAKIQEYKKRMRRIVLVTDEVAIGKQGAGELLLQSFCNGAGVPAPPFLEFQRGGKRKEERLRQAAAFWVDGHMRLIKDAPGVDQLVDQMCRIGEEGGHDDWADPSADTFNPQVYFPMHRIGQSARSGWMSSPQDDVLKDGTLRDEAMLYDAYHGTTAERREPV